MSLFFLTLLSVYVIYEDFKSQIIPDFVHMLLIGFAVICMIKGQWLDIKTASIGLLLGSGLMLLVALCGPIGGGDIKLMGALGTWFGTSIIEVFLLSFIIGFFFAIPYFIKNKNFEQKIPFGPSIAIAAIILWVSNISLFNFFSF